MIKILLKNWTVARALRLALGIFIIVNSIYTNEWGLVFLGALLTLMPLLTVGCCGNTGCSIPSKSEEI